MTIMAVLGMVSLVRMLLCGLVGHCCSSSIGEQRFPFVLTDCPGLLQGENRLLYDQNEEKPRAHYELSQRIVNVDIVLGLYLLLHL